MDNEPIPRICIADNHHVPESVLVALRELQDAGKLIIVDTAVTNQTVIAVIGAGCVSAVAIPKMLEDLYFEEPANVPVPKQKAPWNKRVRNKLGGIKKKY